MSDLATATYLHMAMHAGEGQAAIYSLFTPGAVAVFVFFLIVIGILIICDIL